MTDITTPQAARLPVPHLTRHSGAQARVVPAAPWRGALIAELELLDLRKTRLEVEIAPVSGGFTLTGILGATVVQPCVVTLDPVTTRIDVPLARSYLSTLPDPSEEEAEIPEDVNLEPLGPVIDLEALLVEALALALPDYPRADGAELATTAVSMETDTEETPQNPKPFAGLESLKNKLSDGSDPES